MSLLSPALLLALLGLTLCGELEFESSIGCGKNCETCDHEFDNCAQCGPGFFFHDIDRVCQAAGNSVPNCEYFTTKAVCKLCQPTFAFFAGSCRKCPANCKNCDSDLLSCDLCSPGFVFPNPATKTCTLNCNVLNCDQCTVGNANSCAKCLPGFRVNLFGVCEQCLVANCTTCAIAASQCDNILGTNTCSDGFFLSTGRCERCPDRCKKCSSVGICTACNTVGGSWMYQDMTCKTANIGVISVLWLLLLITIN